MNEPRVLIIDDDERLSEMLASYLRSRGFTVEQRIDGTSGVAAALHGQHDVIVLDIMLPDFDGLEVLRRIRAGSGIPVIMLTARGEEMDRIVGLELGADDYLPKPFNPRELIARISAVLRRGRPAQAVVAGDVLRFGKLEIDRAAREARVAGRPCVLTSHQFSLLLALAERAGRVQTREQLMQAVRGEDLEDFDRSIDVHISRIRAAIEKDPKKPRRIKTVRGAGYIFTDANEDEA
jgi:DNA-binding response OmpR family regulator